VDWLFLFKIENPPTAHRRVVFIFSSRCFGWDQNVFSTYDVKRLVSFRREGELEESVEKARLSTDTHSADSWPYVKNSGRVDGCCRGSLNELSLAKKLFLLSQYFGYDPGLFTAFWLASLCFKKVCHLFA